MADGWVLFCKRTDDPKLAWIERQLAARGIESKRQGRSFHADHCLYVREADEQAAWALLAEKSGLRKWKTLDDVPDDHRMFRD